MESDRSYFLATGERVTFGEIVYPPGGTLGPRLQRWLQIVIVYKGSVSVWIDDLRPSSRPEEHFY